MSRIYEGNHHIHIVLGKYGCLQDRFWHWVLQLFSWVPQCWFTNKLWFSPPSIHITSRRTGRTKSGTSTSPTWEETRNLQKYLKKRTKLVAYPTGQYICNINENSFKTSQTMQISSSKCVSSKTLQERRLQTQNLPALTTLQGKILLSSTFYHFNNVS
jgi:hypothetical protein